MQSILVTRLASIPLVHQLAEKLQAYAIGRYVLVWSALMWDKCVPTFIDHLGYRFIDMMEPIASHVWEAIILARDISIIISRQVMFKIRMQYQELQAAYCHQLLQAITFILHTRVMQHIVVPVIGIITDSTLPALHNIVNALREQLVYYLVLSKVTLQGHLGFVGICAP